MKAMRGAEMSDTDLAGDRAVAAAVAGGDRAAFRRFVETHQHGVIGMLRRLLHDVAAAEDVAQEGFLRVFRVMKNRSSWRETPRWKSLLYTAAANLARNELRRRQAAAASPALPAAGEDPLERAAQAELQRQLQRALETLDAEERLVVLLRDGHEVAMQDIAATLETSERSVRRLLQTAREKLQRRLKPLAGEE